MRQAFRGFWTWLWPIIEGAGSVLDLGATAGPRVDDRTPEEIDAEAVASDWAAVQSDWDAEVRRFDANRR